MLPDTTGRFGLFQVFDFNGAGSTALSTSQIEGEAPHEDLVWGAYNPGAWNAAHSGMYVSRYTLPAEDNSSISGHDLTWWQNNHPDWILYACDSSGNPTKTLAFSRPGTGDVPLDFSNPAVIQYQISQLIQFLKGNGYNTLAADNTDLLNYLGGGNSNFGEAGASGEYGCGTYDSNGNFHRAFDGPFDSANDTRFVTAMVTWVRTVSAALHGAGMKLIVNHPLYRAPTDPYESQLLGAIDGLLYENGFTYYGKYQAGASGLVSNAITWANYTQGHGIAFLITDYMCSGTNGTAPWLNGGTCPTDPNQIPAQQVDWALATYALINQGGADVYISPQNEVQMSYRSEYSDTYGKPCGSYTTLAPNVYERKFAGAIVIVNASGSNYSLALPVGPQYRDIEGRNFTNPLMVAPADGWVIMTTNGCS